MAAKQPKTPAGVVDVTINVDNHTHAGKPCEKGATLTVRPSQAKWMSKNRIIKEEIN